MRSKKIKVVILLLTIILLFVFFGCEKDTKKICDPTQDELDNGKPLRSNYLSYKIEGIQALGEDINITLLIGTRVTKSAIDTYPEENVEMPYRLIVSAVGVEKGDFYKERRSEAFESITSINQDTSNAILILDDYYAENYPYDEENFTQKNVILPQTLFIGNEGVIIVAYYFYFTKTSFTLSYKIENNRILIKKEYEI